MARGRELVRLRPGAVGRADGGFDAAVRAVPPLPGRHGSALVVHRDRRRIGTADRPGNRCRCRPGLGHRPAGRLNHRPPLLARDPDDGHSTRLDRDVRPEGQLARIGHNLWSGPGASCRPDRSLDEAVASGRRHVPHRDGVAQPVHGDARRLGRERRDGDRLRVAEASVPGSESRANRLGVVVDVTPDRDDVSRAVGDELRLRAGLVRGRDGVRLELAGAALGESEDQENCPERGQLEGSDAIHGASLSVLCATAPVLARRSLRFHGWAMETRWNLDPPWST